MTPASDVYPPALRALHWLTAFAIAVLVPTALAMTNLGEGALTNALYEIHKSFGMLAFVIVVLRIAVRLVKGAPPPASSLTPFERLASSIVHKAMYVLVLLLPIGGYLGTAMCCAPVKLFWLVTIPIPVTGSEALAMRILTIHKFGGFLLTALVFAHLGAVAMHSLIKRDGILQRMLPRS